MTFRGGYTLAGTKSSQEKVTSGISQGIAASKKANTKISAYEHPGVESAAAGGTRRPKAKKVSTP